MKNFSETRILYMGTPEMSAKVLESLILDGFNIVAVIAQEDKPQGRKNIICEVPTKIIAKKYNIPVFQPHKIRNDFEFIEKINPDLILTMAYGQIVPQSILDIPKMGALNFHGSILPKYRGAAPIQRALINGEIKTGVTLMKMIDKMDAGKIYAISQCDIDENDNYTSLSEKIVECAIDVYKKNLIKYISGELIGKEQDESFVTFADKIKPEDEKLSLDNNSKDFINYVRGLSYTPGAYLTLNNLKFKIFKARKLNDIVASKIGTITINKTTKLQLIDGEIELLEVQLEGKRKMDGKSFANGNKQFNGTILN